MPSTAILNLLKRVDPDAKNVILDIYTLVEDLIKRQAATEAALKALPTEFTLSDADKADIVATTVAEVLRVLADLEEPPVDPEDPPVDPGDPPVEPPVGPVLGTVKNPSLGGGMSSTVDYSSEVPFIDVMKMSRTWTGHLPGRWGGVSEEQIAAAQRPDGHLRRMPDGAAYLTTVTLLEMPTANVSLAGRYRLTYEGVGEFNVGSTRVVANGPGEVWIDYRPNGSAGIFIDVTKIDPVAGLRLTSMVHEKNLARYAAGEIFNPDFVNIVKDLRTLRFMDWQGTNNSRQVTWGDAPKVSDYTYAWRGVPVEVMATLCNQIGADGWFCIPHMANDNYVEQFATRLESNLDRRLVAKIQNTNEDWNLIFDQFHWLNAQARAQWPGKNDYSGGRQLSAGRLVQIARIFQRVYAGKDLGRYEIVLGAHGADQWLTEEQLTAPLWRELDKLRGGDGRQPADYIDKIAVTGYYAYGLGDGDGASRLYSTLQTQGEAAAINLGIQMMAQSVEGMRAGWLANKALADKYGAKLAVYEGGSHADARGAWQNNTAFQNLLAKIHLDPRIGPIQYRLFEIWKEVGGEEFCTYVPVSRWSKYGYFGYLQHLDDKSPRWDAVVRFNRDVPAWWETRPAGTFVGK